jgi:hypothetical protein
MQYVLHSRQLACAATYMSILAVQLSIAMLLVSSWRSWRYQSNTLNFNKCTITLMFPTSCAIHAFQKPCLNHVSLTCVSQCVIPTVSSSYNMLYHVENILFSSIQTAVSHILPIMTRLSCD